MEQKPQQQSTKIEYKLRDIYEMFVLDGKSRQFTDATLTTYRERLGKFMDWLETQGVTHLEGISAPLIRAYLVFLQDQNLASATQHGAARAIKTFLRFCVREELIAKSAFDKVKMPKPDSKLPVVFSDEDITRIVKACKTAREKALVYFLLDTGVRLSELVALNVGDVDMKTGAVSVKQGKQRKDRVTYLGAKARKQLARYFLERKTTQADTPLFVSEKTGQRLTKWGIVQILGDLGVRTGVAHCSAHTFRRTFCTNCLLNGMDIYRLAALMGHSDIQTMRKYLGFTRQHLQEAHNKSSPVDHL